MALKCVGEGCDPAVKLIDAFCDLWPESSFDGLSLADATALSWWLAGFCTAADWVGSNPKWFQPKMEADSLAAYLEQTRPVAARAVAEAGIAGTGARVGRPFDFELRPMQAACSSVPRMCGDDLYGYSRPRNGSVCSSLSNYIRRDLICQTHTNVVSCIGVPDQEG